MTPEAHDPLAAGAPEPASTELLFHAALERVGRAERDAFLREATRDDDQRARVRALVEAHESAGAFLDPLVPRPEFAGADGRSAEAPGTMIGPYRILRPIGEGGFGAVYLAEQEHPVRREVALKIIKLGMDTRRVIARFEAERQALALTDHPNVAKVLDAGSTETGRPYFVMELVRGISIERFCDAGDLSVAERLELFVDVCRGVHHAHEMGLIHRDLKPSNVLVAMHGDVPVPKIIDFGIAKATRSRLTEHDLSTEQGQFLGTPVYMSPEQASSSGAEVDARSDTYSLGALLYELLTGLPPFDPRELREAGMAELQATLREVDPVPPSTRVAELQTRDEGALARGITPEAWPGLLRGDLDWIVMKALDKEPERRYASAAGFASDLQRYLAHETVRARPPSHRYRMEKFVRRNRLAVAAVGGVTTALLIGCGLAFFGFLRASEEARGYRRAKDFFQEFIASTDPNLASEVDWSVDGLLGRARAAFGEDHASVAIVLGERARQLHRSGSFEPALAFYEAALELSRELYGETSLHVAVLMGRSAALLRDMGRSEKAEERMRGALAVGDALPAPGSADLCDTRSDLARILVKRGEHAEAARLLRAAVETRKVLTPNQRTRIATELSELRDALTLDSDFLGAAFVAAELLTHYKEAYPVSSVIVAREQILNGIWMSTFVSTSQAERQLRAGLEEWRASKAPPRDEYLRGLAALQRIVARSGDDREEAEALLVEWIDLARDVLGPASLELADALTRLAEERELQGRPAEAIPHVLEAVEIRRGAGGGTGGVEPSGPLSSLLERLVRDVVFARGATREALREARNGLEALMEPAPDRPDLYRLQGALRLRMRQPREALISIGLAARLRLQAAPEGHPIDFALMAMAYLQQGKIAEALGMLNRAHELGARYPNDPEVGAILEEAATAVDAAR